MPVPDFSPGEVLTAAAMDSIGLWLVKTQTVGTAVSSVTVSDAFSANYDNYIIQYTGGTNSVNSELRLQLSGATGADYQSSIVYLGYGGVVAGATTTTTAFGWCGSGGTNNSVMNTTLYGPFAAKHTFATTPLWEFPSGIGNSGGRHQLNSSYTGFIVLSATGTMTGGTIRVYGYRN
jgi:hypothetical protein